MKRFILALVLSAISAGANASLIRIDFEGQVYAIFGLAPFAPKSLVTGFIVYDDTWTYDASEDRWTVSGGQIGLTWDSGSMAAAIEVATVNNNEPLGNLEDHATFSGNTRTSTSIHSMSVGFAGDPLLFDHFEFAFPSASDWNLNYATRILGNLNFINLPASGTTWGASYQITDVTVSAVPIPAAIYLFGSALGLFGWMRKHHA